MRVAKFIPKKRDFYRIINFVKFNRSYDDLYLGVTFWDKR